MPLSRSNISQVAPRTSPRRAPVNIKSLMALAETGSVWSFSACARAAISVRLRITIAFLFRVLANPEAGLSVNHFQRIARLNALRSTSTTRLARTGVPRMLVTSR